MAARIGKADFEEKVLKNSLPVLVDFYSESCIPCKQLSPLIGEIEEEREGSVAVYKVNVNYDMELAGEYGVMGVPALRLFIGGETAAQHTGVIKKEELVQWLDEALQSK